MTHKDNDIIKRIKTTIKIIDPKAQVIIFGSRARGDSKIESDWDILFLTDYLVTTEVERSFRNNLFDIEIETGEVFSTFVFQKQIWNKKHKVNLEAARLLSENSHWNSAIKGPGQVIGRNCVK